MLVSRDGATTCVLHSPQSTYHTSMLVKNSCRLTHLYTNPSNLRSELLMSDALKKRRCSRACYKENNSPKKEPNQRRHSESLLFRYSDVIWAGRGVPKYITSGLRCLPRTATQGHSFCFCGGSQTVLGAPSMCDGINTLKSLEKIP